MKKMFILAALLATATAHAQTISGTVNYDVTRAAGVTSSGLTDTTVNFVASEKVGDIVVTAKLGLDGAARDKTLSGRDASIGLQGSFGSVTLGQVEVVNGLFANSFGLASVIGSDGIVVAGKSNQTIATYETPAIGLVSFSITDVQSTAGGTHTQIYGTKITAGKLIANADYTAKSERIRVSGQYDFGFAKVGAGWSGHEDGVKNTHVVAASIPLSSSFALGGAYFNGDGRAYEASGTYFLSKRTSVALAYRDVSANSVVANNGGTTRVRLQHTF